MSSAEERLYTLVLAHQYLESENHYLNELVKEARGAIESDPGEADDLLNRLDKELEVEQETLGHAFKLFDNQNTNTLTRADVTNMNKYLGFPAEDDDVSQLMDIVDTDKSGEISFAEFETYVGLVGGSSKLFEERQRRLKEKFGTDVGVTETESLTAALQQAGIDREAQAYWRMVVPSSEFQEASRLRDCQANAVAQIRRLAKKNHQEALPKLQERVQALGFRDDQLWLTLAWIRELAPIIVHLDINKLVHFFETDTHYRNQFETNSSGGLLKQDVRKKWERDLFRGTYDSASGFERPKYGAQNVMNDFRGVVKCRQYGESYMVLKDIRLRCTFAPEDSANLKADKLAVLDFYAHVLSEYSDKELGETINVANSADAAILGDSEVVGSMKYKEVQIHGEVAFGKHVERLVAHTKHRDDAMQDRLEKICAMHGWAFSWMDQEQERMRAEQMHKLGGADWQARLQALQEGGGDINVPEGFCKVGCGRRVAPGITRAGKPFTTCCRGCIMGFGHDRLCGQIDASKVGPGLCKNGCGLKVAPGRDGQGRPFTTCCRGCALGMGHSANCQQPLEAPKAGCCKMGCGRAVAPGCTPAGRPFDTCCRPCARGRGHAEDCLLSGD